MNIKLSDDGYWFKKIKAYLHDLPDKFIKINEHEKRRDDILKKKLELLFLKTIMRMLIISLLLCKGSTLLNIRRK
ncbi:MAG: hypothetical protein ACTSR0_03620 [Candidatus Asgardarchaeia archaeon]